jgi:hypothetical protein
LHFVQGCSKRGKEMWFQHLHDEEGKERGRLHE